MTETFTVETKVPLTRVADLLCSALEGGSSYWARIGEYETPPEPVAHVTRGDDKAEGFPHIDYPLCVGGAVIIQELRDDGTVCNVHRLDRPAVKRGLEVMAREHPRHWARFISEDDDAETGDVFLQCCLLGEIVYG